MLKDVIYRGTVLDYVLALAGGQEIVATSTERHALSSGATVEVAIAPEDIVVLAD
jgi:hypothetical protein